MIPGLTCHRCNAPISGERGAPMARRTPLGLQHVTCPKRARNLEWKQQITLARIEDLAFMADTGETRWADLFGAAPNYTGGVPVDEWLEAHRG